MSRLYIVVANRAHARIFKNRDSSELEELAVLSCPSARLSGHNLATDTAGRGNNPQGFGHHDVEEPERLKENIAEDFARRLTRMLEQDYHEGKFKEFALIAPPRFLGLVRQSIGKNLAKALVYECGKDIIRCNTDEILDYLPKGFLAGRRAQF